MPGCLSDNTLSAFSAGSLPETERAEVESHIDGCETCRELVAELAAAQISTSRPSASRRARVGELGEPIASPPPAQIGEFRILRPIGHGHMGQVYEAHDTELERRVAIKLLRTGSSDALSRERLRIEARAIARLNDPGVVAVYRVGDVEGQPVRDVCGFVGAPRNFPRM